MPRLSAHHPLTVALTAAGFVLAGGGVAGAAPAYVPGEVLVRYEAGVGREARAATQRATRTGRPEAFAPRARTLRIRGGASVAETVRALRRRPGVASAGPNWIARAGAFIPNDPGASGTPGGWAGLQWNFVGEYGVRAPEAWDTLMRQGRPGGAGVTVAVLDTGVAYADARRFRRSPDLSGSRLRRGYDFVASDPYPDDHNGHGTHVASTVAESADNEVGLVGLAYGARIMPVRVLDSRGEGNAADIARGIRFAARNGAQIINLSFEFDSAVTRASIPEVLSAMRYARSKGSLVVGASGNTGGRTVAYPARSAYAVAVGATTERGCQAEYSNRGSELDLVAPGGGPDAAIAGDIRCRPEDPPGRDIFQVTFKGSVRRFGIPPGYVGTSMAAPHVSAVAALVLASGVLGRDPSPRRLEAHLEATARDLGRPGRDWRYGAGLLDAARATAPAPPSP
jgi:serine protease